MYQQNQSGKENISNRRSSIGNNGANNINSRFPNQFPMSNEQSNHQFTSNNFNVTPRGLQNNNNNFNGNAMSGNRPRNGNSANSPFSNSKMLNNSPLSTVVRPFNNGIQNNSTNSFQSMSKNEQERSVSVGQNLMRIPPSKNNINSRGFEAGTSSNRPNTTVTNNNEASQNAIVNKTLTKKNEMQKVRIFTGTVEKVIEWHRIYTMNFCYYEVIAAMICIQEGTIRLQKVMLLRDKKGPILQVQHYTKDHINIENFFVGQMLRCVGHMVGPNIIHAVSIREAKGEEISTLRRLCYIGDHAIAAFK